MQWLCKFIPLLHLTLLATSPVLMSTHKREVLQAKIRHATPAPLRWPQGRGGSEQTLGGIELRALQWPCLQEAVEKREAEIVRLGAEAGAGRDVDVTALQYRSEAQENLILQLNEQVRPLLKCPSHSS